MANANGTTLLPFISKLDSESDDPEPGSDEDDLNLSNDDDNLGALAFQMQRNSVVGASSGRGGETGRGDNKKETSLTGLKGIQKQMPTSMTTQVAPGFFTSLVGKDSNSQKANSQSRHMISASNIERVSENGDKRQGILSKRIIVKPIRKRHGSHDPDHKVTL